jgi:Ca-activated chloride channel family protein
VKISFMKIVSVFRNPISLALLLWISAGVSLVCAQTPADLGEPPPGRPVLRTVKPTLAVPPATQQPATEDEPEFDENDVVRVSTSLITVPAEVMDRSGRYIGNLRKDDFRIYENGVEQDLAYFTPVEQPFTVALLLDVSGSTQSQLQSIRNAANTFIKGLRPNDRLLLVSFDGKINVLTEAVTLNDLRKMKLRLDAVNDGTLLYDAMGFVLNQRLAGIKGRKAIVVFTDGVDGGSKKGSYKQNIRDAEEANVVIYTVQYNTLPQLPERLSHIVNPKVREKIHEKLVKQYGVGSTYLHALAEKTGGRLYEAENLSDVPQVFGAITRELGRQYSLGYYPKGQARPGEKREIKVKTRSANLIVRARESYVANAAGRPGDHE